jgi:hypothetical protein
MPKTKFHKYYGKPNVFPPYITFTEKEKNSEGEDELETDIVNMIATNKEEDLRVFIDNFVENREAVLTAKPPSEPGTPRSDIFTPPVKREESPKPKNPPTLSPLINPPSIIKEQKL